MAKILRQNIVPEVLRSHPEAVTSYLTMRPQVIRRLHRQKTGHWQPGGEALEVHTREEMGRALDLLAGGDPVRWHETGISLLSRGDHAMALRIADLGLEVYPGQLDLQTVRQRALEGLREKYQQLNPFKFIIYSELANSETPRITELP